MVTYATEPNVFDVAVAIIGDQDFVPAIQRTREKRKKKNKENDRKKDTSQQRQLEQYQQVGYL